MNTNQREEPYGENIEAGIEKDKNGTEENNTARTSIESLNNGTNSNQEMSDKYVAMINELKGIVNNLNTKIGKMDQELKTSKEESSQTKNNLEEKINKIKEESSQEINKLKNKINTIEDENYDLTSEIINLKEKMFEREVIIKRNNINVDLLANRDSLKSILLLLSFNLQVTTKDEIQKISRALVCKKKFSCLVVSVLRKLKQLLNSTTFSRRGVENTKNVSEEKELYMNKIKFVECIHFIVCTIDNIVHPEKEVNEGTYSKIIGNRGEEALKKSLIYFFKDPTTFEELEKLFKEEELKVEEIKNQEKNEINDNKNEERNIKESLINDDKKDGNGKNNEISENMNMNSNQIIPIEKNKNSGENNQNIIQKKIDNKNKEIVIEKSEEENIPNLEKIVQNIGEIKKGDKNSNTQQEEKKKEEENIMEESRKLKLNLPGKNKAVINKKEEGKYMENTMKENMKEEYKKEKTKKMENVVDKVHDSQNNDIDEQTKIEKEVKNEIIEIDKKRLKKGDSKNIKVIEKKELQKNELINKEIVNNELISFENYYYAKNKTYIQNKDYYSNLNGTNNYYSNNFFIEHLFEPNKDSFSNVTLTMNYENFISILNQTKNEFKSLTNVTVSDLINKLKWMS